MSDRLATSPADTVACVPDAGNIYSVLDQPLQPEDILDWHSPELPDHDAGEKAGDLLSLMVFRVADSWLALPAGVLDCVTLSLPTHRLPYVRHPAILGVVNLRGDITVKLSMATLLGLDSQADSHTARTEHMALAMALGNNITLFEAEQIHGVVKIAASSTMPVSRTSTTVGGSLQKIRPDTGSSLPSSMQNYTKSIFYFTHGAVGILDTERLQYTFQRHLS